MPRFIDVHSDMKGITQQQLEEAHRQDAKLQPKTKVQFLKAWADPKTGKVFCLSEGPSKDAVLRAHREAGHATEEIYEVPIAVE